jgi:hypothetical protein
MKVLGVLTAAEAAFMLSLAWPALATAADVVPNPGFEQGGCGASTPIICGWKLVGASGTCGPTGPCTSTAMYQDAAAHTGSASMALLWGTDFSEGFGGVEAATDSAFCAQIGSGAHPASFWYIGDPVSMGVSSYQGADCTGTAADASLSDPGASKWSQVTGVLVAPPGTQSALFWVGVSASCDYAAGCSAAANFDDLDVESSLTTAPFISSFTPGFGPTGTSVDIAGVNFSGASSVTFNGTPAAFSVNSDAEIHAIVPAGATTGSIAVTTPTGTATSNASFGVAPTISSFTPTCGPAGATIDIVGSGFAAASGVTFNGTSAGFTVNSDTEIHATVPSGATYGPIAVLAPADGTTGPYDFRGPCNSPPTINSFTPTSGTVGTTVDILGFNFTGATSVTFNGIPATYRVDFDSEIHVTVPDAASTGPIAVTTPSGPGGNGPYFTVITPAPTIGSFTPSSGPVGTGVDIQGTNFTGTTSVKFNGTSDMSFVVNSATDLTAHIPAGATTGPISVTTPGGAATSSSPFVVTLPPPTITGFSPTSGHAGQQVTITGSNFTGATRVDLGTTSATFSFSSSTMIAATVPTIAHGYYKWSVTTPFGTGIAAGSFHVT